MYRLLAEYHRTHPGVTLAALVGGEAGWGVPENDARYATGALFVDALYRREGMPALRTLDDLPSSGNAFLAAMRIRLALPASDPSALESWWRQAAQAAAERR